MATSSLSTPATSAGGKAGQNVQIAGRQRWKSAVVKVIRTSTRAKAADDGNTTTAIVLTVPDLASSTIDSTCLSQLSCLCCTSPCHFCCKSCPSMKESTSTNMMYLIMCGCCILMALCSLIGTIPQTLSEVVPFMDMACTGLLHTEPGCVGLFGTHASVYKMCTGQLSLHILMIPLTISVKDSLSPLARLHNGFWMWKFVWVFGVIIAMYIIPDQSMLGVFIVLRYMGMIGGSLFILADVFFICEMALSINTLLLDKAALRSAWYILIWIVTLTFLALFVLLCLILTKYYSLCSENTIIISINIAASVLLVLLTVIPGFGRGSFNLDLLPAMAIAAYIMYQTWAALHNRPLGDFNKDVLGQIIAKANDIKALVEGITDAPLLTAALVTDVANFSLFNLTVNNTIADVVNLTSSVGPTTQPLRCFVELFSSKANTSLKLQYISLSYYMFIALYKSVSHTLNHAATMKKYSLNTQKFKRASLLQKGKLETGSDQKGTTIEEGGTTPHTACCTCIINCDRFTSCWESCTRAASSCTRILKKRLCGQCCIERPLFANAQKIIYNDTETTSYNYCYMHFQFSCSILFVMMTLTNWFSPESTAELSHWTPNWASFWVQLATTWCTIVVYILTLYLPVHCQDNQLYQKAVEKHIFDAPRKSMVPHQSPSTSTPEPPSTGVSRLNFDRPGTRVPSKLIQLYNILYRLHEGDDRAHATQVQQLIDSATEKPKEDPGTEVTASAKPSKSIKSTSGDDTTKEKKSKSKQSADGAKLQPEVTNKLVKGIKRKSLKTPTDSALLSAPTSSGNVKTTAASDVTPMATSLTPATDTAAPTTSGTLMTTNTAEPTKPTEHSRQPEIIVIHHTIEKAAEPAPVATTVVTIPTQLPVPSVSQQPTPQQDTTMSTPTSSLIPSPIVVPGSPPTIITVTKKKKKPRKKRKAASTARKRTRRVV